MPRTIAIDSPECASLPEVIEALAQLDFDPLEEESTLEAAMWLAA